MEARQAELCKKKGGMKMHDKCHEFMELTINSIIKYTKILTDLHPTQLIKSIINIYILKSEQ